VLVNGRPLEIEPGTSVSLDPSRDKVIVEGRELAGDLVEIHRPELSRWQRFKRSRAGRIARTALLPLLFLASKFKSVLLLATKFKFGATLVSMFVSVGAYALFWGPAFATGFVVLLFLHEYGHVFQLRREGIKASAPFFIPFLGAMISMRELPNDAAAEARVGLAGPIAGSAAALVPLAIWLATGNQFWEALAYVGFFLNLFNLLPITPLDGGRAIAAISPWFWIVGFLGLVGVLFVAFSPLLVLIMVVGGVEALSRLIAHRRSADRHYGTGYYKTSKRTKVFVAVVYLGLAAALTIGMTATHVTLD
jgi:Zn-dependent protease